MSCLHSRLLVVFAAGLLLWGVRPAPAQDAPRSGFTAILDNMDLMIDSYARMLGRKYDLTDEQGEFTKQMLRERVNDFLSKHDGEVRGLLDTMFAVRSGQDISPAELMEWGRRAAPLLNEAKQIVTEGNNEWRQILTEEQRLIHDEDLKLMAESFQTSEEQLSRIVTGEMTVEEFRRPTRLTSRPPRARPLPSTTPPEPSISTDEHIVQGPRPGSPPHIAANNPDQSGVVTPPGEAGNGGAAAATEPRVSRPAGGRPGIRNLQPGARAARGDQQPASPTSEDEWERYTREFGERHQFTQEQRVASLGILKDCQEQRARLMQSRTPQLTELEKQIAELASSQDKDRAAKLKELNDRKTKLMEPIGQIFERQLKPRLERLPTRAQRRAAESAPKPAAGATPTGRPVRKPAVQPPAPPAQPEEPAPQNPNEPREE